MKIKKKVETKDSQSARPARRSRGQFWNVEDVIRPDMIPYLFWKEWSRARDRGDFPFLFRLVADEGPARELWGSDLEAFQEACRRSRSAIPGLAPAELFRIRLEGKDIAHLIQCRRHDERGTAQYEAERMLLLRSPEAGWRVQRIDRIEVAKETEPGAVRIEDFPDVGEIGREVVSASPEG